MAHEQSVMWFAEKSAQLAAVPNEKKEILIEMKSGVTFLDNQSLLLLAQSSNLNSCFDCINADIEEAELASEILFHLLDVLPAAEALHLYGLPIQNALAHPSIQVKRLFLKLLLKYVTADGLVLFTEEHTGVLTCVIECLACPDRGVAEGSVQFFKQIGKSLQGVQILFTEGFEAILKRIMMVNDITRFRIYEIIVDVAVKHSEALEAAHTCGILPSLLSELKSSDTLIQLNALELLTNLTANSAGLLYLQREGIIKYLVNQIVNIATEPLSFILLPGLIEFFGNLYRLQPVVFSKQHPEVLQLLFNSFETVDPALLGVVMSTFGKIGSTDEGKRVLLAHEDGLLAFFKKVGEVLKRKDALCVTAMNMLGVLLQTDCDELSIVTRRWFDALSPEALPTLIATAKLPFVEMRFSALQLLGVLSSQSWGPKIICTWPGLLEFLLDRGVEFDKDCKVSKYNVVKALSLNPTTASDVTGGVLTKLNQHVNEGPFYVSTELQTAFEQA